jgi:putative oxidoreductase
LGADLGRALKAVTPAPYWRRIRNDPEAGREKGANQSMNHLFSMLDAQRPRALSVLRFVAGLLFLEHGLSKFFGWPVAGPELHGLLWLAALLETAGGAAIALGLFTRPVAFLLSGEMAVAYFTGHAPRSIFPLGNGGDAAILYCFVFLYFVFAGGGPWSLDDWRGGA